MRYVKSVEARYVSRRGELEGLQGPIKVVMCVGVCLCERERDLIFSLCILQ